jgi:hypothetical protein
MNFSQKTILTFQDLRLLYFMGFSCCCYILLVQQFQKLSVPNCWFWELSVDLRLSLLNFYKFYPSGDSQNVVLTQPIQKEYLDIDAMPMPGQNSPLYKYYPQSDTEYTEYEEDTHYVPVRFI